jgi:NADH-quinone oxidoreductase subunit M
MVDATLATWLSAIVFLPAAGALGIAFIPGHQKEAIRWATLGICIAVLAACGYVFFLDVGVFKTGIASMQDAVNLPWIPSFDIDYFLGVDGISFPLIMLTAVVTALSMGASWPIEKHVKAYCILFLLLLTGMLGVFMALDLFLFYVFWEVMLLPMYFLIGVWGGPRKEYAAIKFFLYTLVGSVLMLIAILMLYFNSDLRALAAKDADGKLNVAWSNLHLGESSNAKLGRAEFQGLTVARRDEATAGQPLTIRLTGGEGTSTTASYDAGEHTIAVLLATDAKAGDVATAINTAGGIATARATEGSSTVKPQTLSLPAYSATGQVHTFNILALAAMGQNTDLFDVRYTVWPLGKWFSNFYLTGTLQHWAFWLLFIGFAIKVPSVPVHTWLPDAHVEAPTPISMILAGVLLKMGGYGILRICYPICPAGGYDGAYVVCALGVISMVYGGFAALAQKDFKRMVAYSSVSHMGYVVLGLGVWSATRDLSLWDPQYWSMGVKGAMFQMIGHGISSPGMFFMVGVIYERVHHRNLEEFGGLFGKMPVYTALAMGLFFAGLGLPGLCGFPGEVWSVLSAWKYSKFLAIVSAGVVVVTAAYILWAVQRVYLGAEYRGPHEEDITPSTPRENFIGGVLLGLAILFGVFPNLLLRYMDATVNQQTATLAEWTKNVKESPRPSPTAAARNDAAEQREPAIAQR